MLQINILHLVCGCFLPFGKSQANELASLFSRVIITSQPMTSLNNVSFVFDIRFTSAHLKQTKGGKKCIFEKL